MEHKHFNYTPLSYFYDGQLTRYYLQFQRIFSGFQYETGRNGQGIKSRRRIPCHYGNPSRMVAHILRNNSKNVLNSVPRITCYITGLSPSPERRQDPQFTGKIQVSERKFNEQTQEYTDQPGNSVIVERYMPVPYELTLNVDIWTSNMDQKLQIMEQILTLFNPALDLQTGTNPLDWTSITVVELTDVNWSSQSIPIGADDQLEIATLTFKIPIWINPPAKVMYRNVIEQIVLNLGEPDEMQGIGDYYDIHWSDEDLLSRIIITPEDARIVVDDIEVTLLTQTEDGWVPTSWDEYLKQYPHEFRPGITQLRLKTTSDIEEEESDIVGILDWHPNEPEKLLWQPSPESLPVNTLGSIDATIDPQKSSPGNGLPQAEEGQRYLIVQDVGPCEAWGNLTASANDIIEYAVDRWTIAFTATSSSNEYVLNNYNGKQQHWDGTNWYYVPDGEYLPGFWRIFL